MTAPPDRTYPCRTELHRRYSFPGSTRLGAQWAVARGLGTDADLARIEDGGHMAGATPELACAPIGSEFGKRHFGVTRAGINCALANRQILTHIARGVFWQWAT